MGFLFNIFASLSHSHALTLEKEILQHQLRCLVFVREAELAL